MFEFGAPSEESVPAEKIPVANTAPTPPLIIEIIDDEEEEVTAGSGELILTDEPTVMKEELPSQPAIQEELPEVIEEQKEQPEVQKPSVVTIQEETPTEETPVQQEETPVQPKRISSTRGRKSLKETAITADLIQVPEDDILFSKQYYPIGEVAAMFRENQSLIRYWETEFDILQPKKNKKGDRFFRPVDIKNLVLIYDLLRRRKFTIEGAKDFLKRNKKAEDKFAMIQSLEKVKTFLLELRSNL